ncbi:MAG: DUF456 domain-containing protein [Patescibacteria group bacterium]|jgi:hypothetical protein
MELANPLLFWVTLVIVTAGFVGIFFPLVPNIPLIWLGILLYAAISGFEEVTNEFILFISFLALITIFLDFISARWGVRKFTASGNAVIGAVLGGVIGSLFGQLWAFFMGPLLGAVLFQLFTGHDTIWSIRGDRFHIIGFMGGSVMKLVIAITMIGMFLWVVLV